MLPTAIQFSQDPVQLRMPVQTADCDTSIWVPVCRRAVYQRDSSNQDRQPERCRSSQIDSADPLYTLTTYSLANLFRIVALLRCLPLHSSVRIRCDSGCPCRPQAVIPVLGCQPADGSFTTAIHSNPHLVKDRQQPARPLVSGTRHLHRWP